MSRSQFDDEPHIETSSEERLAYMANQIARFFAAQSHEKAVAGVADHIAKFWDPRMRDQIAALWRSGGQGLDPIAREAIGLLQR